MKSVVVIPARFKSSRFPGKPLVPLLGKPMVLWVAELSAKAVGKANVYIATEDERIADVVTEAGFNVVMTSAGALTGTDRLAEAAKQIDADIYINVQGDEPVIDPLDIQRIIKVKEQHMQAVINGFCWIGEDEDPTSVNIPKVVTNEKNDLMYMSRLAVPGFKDSAVAPLRYKKQVCIYAFTAQQLGAYVDFGRKGEVERSEDIEILRFLELSVPVKMVETSGGSLAVDVPEDVAIVEAVLKKGLINAPQ